MNYNKRNPYYLLTTKTILIVAFNLILIPANSKADNPFSLQRSSSLSSTSSDKSIISSSSKRLITSKDRNQTSSGIHFPTIFKFPKLPNLSFNRKFQKLNSDENIDINATKECIQKNTLNKFFTPENIIPFRQNMYFSDKNDPCINVLKTQEPNKRTEEARIHQPFFVYLKNGKADSLNSEDKALLKAHFEIFNSAIQNLVHIQMKTNNADKIKDKIKENLRSLSERLLKKINQLNKEDNQLGVVNKNLLGGKLSVLIESIILSTIDESNNNLKIEVPATWDLLVNRQIDIKINKIITENPTKPTKVELEFTDNPSFALSKRSSTQSDLSDKSTLLNSDEIEYEYYEDEYEYAPSKPSSIPKNYTPIKSSIKNPEALTPQKPKQVNFNLDKTPSSPASPNTLVNTPSSSPGNSPRTSLDTSKQKYYRISNPFLNKGPTQYINPFTVETIN